MSCGSDIGIQGVLTGAAKGGKNINLRSLPVLTSETAEVQLYTSMSLHSTGKYVAKGSIVTSNYL